MVASSDAQIRLAAIERFNVTDANVSRYEVKPPADRRPTENHEYDLGVWFTLAVKRLADSAWEVVGRRRTRGELLAMIEKRSPAARELP